MNNIKKMEEAHRQLSLICKQFTCTNACPLYNFEDDYCAYELLDKQINKYKEKINKERIRMKNERI